MYSRLLTATATAMALFAAVPALASQVIYDNFSEGASDPNNPYNDATVNGFGVQWSQQQGFGSAWAMPFTVSTGSNIPLLSISLGMYKQPDNNGIGINHDNLTILLVKDAGGLPSTSPAGIVETLAVNPSIPEDSASFLNLNSVLHPLLMNGATYWVVAEPTTLDLNDTNNDSLFYWIQNDEGAQFDYTINEYTTFDNLWTGWFDQPFTIDAPTLDVLGGTVPEPGSLALLGTGLAGLAFRRRRRT